MLGILLLACTFSVAYSIVVQVQVQGSNISSASLGSILSRLACNCSVEFHSMNLSLIS